MSGNKRQKTEGEEKKGEELPPCLVITHEDIMKANITPEEVSSTIEQALLDKGGFQLPKKVVLRLENDGFFTTMPCVESSYSGVKLVNRVGNRSPALLGHYSLYRSSDQRLLSFMDSNWITSMRTGAVAANTVKVLAVPDFKTIGLIGLGNSMRAMMLCLVHLYPDRKMTVKLLKYKDQADSFQERFKEYKNVTWEVKDNLKDICVDSDVMISAITSAEKASMTEVEWFKKGAVVVAIHMRGFMNLDTNFDKVFGDDEGHLNHFKLFSKWKYFAEITDVMKGTKKGRESNDERILVYNYGIAMHDLRLATLVYKKCLAQKLGVSLDPSLQEGPKAHIYI